MRWYQHRTKILFNTDKDLSENNDMDNDENKLPKLFVKNVDPNSFDAQPTKPKFVKKKIKKKPKLRKEDIIELESSNNDMTSK